MIIWLKQNCSTENKGYYEWIKAEGWGWGYFRLNVYDLETAFLLYTFFPMAYLIVWALPIILKLIFLVFEKSVRRGCHFFRGEGGGAYTEIFDRKQVLSFHNYQVYIRKVFHILL